MRLRLCVLISLGEQLEAVHQQRQRAQAAYDLIDFYNQFSRDDPSQLDAMKKEGKEGRRKVAVLLRRLNIVAKEVDLPHADKVCLISDCDRRRCLIIVHRQGTILTGTAKSLRRTCSISLTERTARVTRR